MSKDYEITYCAMECLEQTINILKEISKEYEWENDEYKDEMELFFKILGKKIKENQDIIKEAKYYANIT